ncbi:MAG: S8 family serine peptidase [Pseudomonadota bacterium]
MRAIVKPFTVTALALVIAFGGTNGPPPALAEAGRVGARAADRVIERRHNRIERLQRAQRILARRWVERRPGRAIAARRAAARHRFAMSRNGALALRGEIVAIAPDEAVLARARALGFRVARQVSLPALGLDFIVLRAPKAMDTNDALERLRASAPQGQFELNHLFDPSGELAMISTGDMHDLVLPWPDLVLPQGARLGLVDLGVDAGHPTLRGAAIETASFAGEETPTPSAHGTAVASLLVGEDGRFHGAAKGARLFAADVFGDADAGGSALAIAQALAWLAEKRIPVIAMPLTGPANQLLALSIARLQAKGVLIVAPVGNEGPTRPIAFPAAYPGVVAVTATDWEGRIFIGANRGEAVMFSAVGVDIYAAADPEKLITVTGTSFAVPEVAARLLQETAAPDPGQADRALAKLRQMARDLGAPGRDDIYGYGWVSQVGASDPPAQFSEKP